MNARKTCIAVVLCGSMAILACSGSHSAAPSVEHDGLVITFTPVCVDGEIKLRGEIFNAGSESIQIESGALPWQYDLLGTDFQAESAGKKLTKNTTTPLIGKTGPKMLAGNERRQGLTPIGFIFPELKSLLAKQSVTVTWTYPLTGTSGGSANQIRGSVEVLKDPCES